MKVTLIFLSLILCCSCAAKRIVVAPPMNSSEVRFGFAKDRMHQMEEDKLNASIAYLKNYPQKIVIVEGHTDQIGQASFNLELGDRRAHEVMAYLISKGVSPDQIVIVSFGEEQPKDQYKYSKNRRAVVRLTNSQEAKK